MIVGCPTTPPIRSLFLNDVVTPLLCGLSVAACTRAAQSGSRAQFNEFTGQSEAAIKLWISYAISRIRAPRVNGVENGPHRRVPHRMLDLRMS